MAKPSELPQLVSEFVDMSKEYLRQETLEPAKQLGRFAGFSMAGALAFTLGTLFLAVAGLRWLRKLFPEDSAYLTGVGYLLAAVALIAVAGIIVAVGSRDSTNGG